MSRIAEVFRTNPLLWSPTDLALVNEFFKTHHAVFDLIRQDATIRKRQATRLANAKTSPVVKPMVAKKVVNRKAKKKKTKLDSIDLDDLIANAKGAKA